VQLADGLQLGPYLIIAPLGAGGMGEVYRARDPRIGREVAIKILPASYLTTPDRLRRFEQEARAAGALNHPNLLTVFELGTHEGSPFIVSELVEGSTLREILTGDATVNISGEWTRAKGALTLRRAIELAIQLANGLAAAHDKLIVHRDLKPENVMITSDRRVKLLDFGLAKLLDEAPFSDDATLNKQTHPGVVLGTVAYMSPEQVRGDGVDHRSDIFALGTVLYEMLTGSNPFHRDSPVETMNAILKDETPALASSFPPALDRIVRHALEKNPRDRFQSVRDFAFALENLSGSGETEALAKPKRSAAKKLETPLFKRLTFRRGFLMNGRFAPDGSIVYAAAWDDEPIEVFSTAIGTRMSRSIGIHGADVLAVSRTGELAVSLNRRFVHGWVTTGTLARVPLLGGAPREVCEDVQEAEWSSDGKTLIILRRVAGAFRIESPIGHVLFRSVNWISNLRLSPKGDMIAFIEHPHYGDDRGPLVIIDLEGREIVRSSSFTSTAGAAWAPKGSEVWIASEREETGRDIRAVSLDGKERTIYAAPGRLSLFDIRKDGTVLMSFDNCRREIIAGTVGGNERNLSWFDWSFLTAVTADGSRILFEEQGAFSLSSGDYQIYVRGFDGSPGISIGEGYARAISADGKWVVAKTGHPPSLDLLPVGADVAKHIPLKGLEGYFIWELTPDQKRIVIMGNEPDHGTRLFVVELDGDGTPRPISPEGTGAPLVVSPDGSAVAALDAQQRVTVFPIDGGEPRTVKGCLGGERPLAWSLEGDALLVGGRGRVAVEIYKVDLASGERSLFHTLRPADPGGIMDIQPIHLTPGGKHYAYGYRRYLSDLFVVSGLR
jgi:eukaryotic-like serine/threonine-protein kinase